MNQEQAILNLLGIAASARKVVTGEEQVVKEVRNQQAKLVILSTDASKNTRKKLTDKCHSFHVELHEFSTRDVLGHALGREARVSVAIMDSGFARKLSQLLNEI
ncbi:YlxQ family RNA-binding protein [Rummeliibacillus sp. G93]|uniref:50S ribosomal protein L7 n=1 Tax=Rummeliibacillus stabekisii TaxID=241244 RepID=A0A143H9Y8_9BACL|nr:MULTISPECIES: YlxQ family RNA-binding protein [Rummeliibacillus]AMW98528.1 50S ribosomal protein L7 [Rummeliibacillus stabekisii]MBB5169840.1 ribosomal protein L7Ae-like RNA K-turn-binding protein [Rummeliibacillus stabekisii]MCM3315856.1 YlxQ family RNA-binding protein [Rummeliibacillus stabekisii]UQW98422.1 YlxQ family RNA-binding protein [Rummeliibacillus sp. G93]GEL04098.1 putative ribosomal protein YlxQ [Rummeliibacillus stabekisii]